MIPAFFIDRNVDVIHTHATALEIVLFIPRRIWGSLSITSSVASTH